MNHFKNISPKCSVIIAVYNYSRYFELVLLSLSRQTENNFEIVVADDGSDEQIRNVITQCQSLFNHKIIHVWQEKKGFRKTVIVNKAISKANGQYLIFMDGDCLAGENFVRMHLENAQKDAILLGRRVMFGPKISSKIDSTDILDGEFENILGRNLWYTLIGDIKRLEQGISIRNPFLSRLINRKPKGLLGSNFSTFKDAMLKVNGYNEDITGRGVEDTDLEKRLKLAGFSFKNIKHKAIQFHLHHSFEIGNTNRKELFLKVEQLDYFYTKNGLDKYL